MTTVVAEPGARSARSRRPAVLLIGLSAVAWAVTVPWATGMGNGPGPMGLDIGPFLAGWVLMMAAMMLPALSGMLTRVASRLAEYAATGEFVAAYLLVWALAGSVIYAISLGTEPLGSHHPTVARVLAVALFGLCGAYQMSTWKWRALRSCAVPVAPAGARNALRAGVGYGTRCIATSWSAMTLLIAVGLMQVAAMVVIAAALFVERRAQRRGVCVVLGLLALGYGVAVAGRPTLAAGLSVPMSAM